MSNKTTSFVLGDKLDALIQQEVQSGHYKNASEVVRAGLRLLFEKRLAEHQVIGMVEEAQEMGYVKNFDWDDHIEELKAKYKDQPKK